MEIEDTETAPPPKPKRPAVARWLFGIGIASSLLGLLGSLSDSVPVLQVIVSPEYARCKAGLTTLQKTRKLTRDQTGCENLAHIVLTRLATDKPQSRNLNFGPIEHFTIEQSVGISFSKGVPNFGVIRIDARFKNGDVQLKMAELQAAVDELKTESKAQYSVLLWSIGFVSFVTAFLTKKA